MTKIDLNKLNVTDEEAEEVEETESEAQSFVVPPKIELKDHYLEVGQKELVAALKVLMAKKLKNSDIVSKSVLIRLKPNGTMMLYGSGGDLYVEFEIPCKFSGFPEFIITGIELFHSAVKHHYGKSLFFYEDNRFQTFFHSGRLGLSMETVDRKMFKAPSLGKPNKTSEFPAESFLDGLNFSRPFLSLIKVPEISALYCGKDGMFASTGEMIMGADIPLPEMILRIRDVPLILIGFQGQETVGFEDYDGHIRLLGDGVSMILPKMSNHFPKRDKSYLGTLPSSYMVDGREFLNILDVIKIVPHNSEQVFFEFKPDELKGLFVTTLGESNDFVLSNTVEGGGADAKTSGFDLSNLISAIKVFRGAGPLNISYDKSSLRMNTKDRHLSFILKRGKR